jgi:hypothetical protein
MVGEDYMHRIKTFFVALAIMLIALTSVKGIVAAASSDRKYR